MMHLSSNKELKSYQVKNMISVIVPIYNVSNYLLPCLTSLYKQSYKNFEIIFINDNSTDDSIEVLNTFLQKTNQHITHTVISHPSNKGLGAARNTGINVAQGDFLFFLDSDDVLAYDALENLIKAQNLYDADVVIGSVGLIDESGQKIKEYIHQSRLLNIEKDRKYLLGRNFVCAWGKLFKKQYFLSTIGQFPETGAYEDCIPYLKMILSTKTSKIYEVPSIAVFWRQRPGSISRSHTREDDILTYLKYFQKKLNTKDLLLFISESRHWYSPTEKLTKIYSHFLLNSFQSLSLPQLLIIDSASVNNILLTLGVTTSSSPILNRVKLLLAKFKTSN